MTDPAVRKSALDQSVAQHLTGGWSLVARVSDEIAVVEWQGRARRTLTVAADGTVVHADSSDRVEVSPSEDVPVEAIERGASPFPWRLALAVTLVMLALFALAVGSGARDGDSPTTRRANMLDAQERAHAREIPTLASFERIRLGMTYEEVVSTIGRPGIESTRSKGHVIYSWKRARCCANMSVHFRDGRVISKSQAGLE